jgi:hypothetical protein
LQSCSAVQTQSRFCLQQKIGGDASTRHRTFAISIAPQDEIRVEGLPDRGDPAALGYAEITATPSSAAPN